MRFILEGLPDSIETAITNPYLKYIYLVSVLNTNMAGTRNQYAGKDKTEGRKLRKIQIMC